MMKCQKCGAEVEKDDTYCPDCGEKLAKEAKKVTVWTILKIIGAILLFIIFLNIFKNNPLIAIFLMILFLMWTGILNSILKKLFNAEISTGVKIVVTAVLILLLLGIAQTQTLKTKPMEVQTQEFRVMESEDFHGFVEKLSSVIEARDYGSLEIMLKDGRVSPEVFEGLLKLLESRDDISITLKPQDQRFYGNQMELNVIALIKTDYGAQRREGVRFFFEKDVNFENTRDFKWKLVKIDPNLLNIKLQRTFEEEAGSKIKQVSKPIIAISETGETGAGYT